MRYLGIVSYRGTNFCGWQKQTVSKLPSIEETIEKVITRILSNDTKIYGSGRTDAGVHALGQTFHFDSKKELNVDKFGHSLNELLPEDIRIQSIIKVSNDFHARFNAKSKTYLYKIKNSKVSDPFKSDLEYTLGQKLDVEKMVEASKIFVGKHNFQNFTSKEEDEQKFSRNIGEITINSDKNDIEITLKGDGFMRYMVRMIVGNLIQVGLGKMTSSDVKKALENKERKPSSYKAPAHGLYLKEVEY
jgi:tRNA pseudouridine38-40 synthase